MEKYPYLNEAIASVLRKKREELGMSKRKLSELAMIERAYITGLEAGKWNATMNVIFYLIWCSHSKILMHQLKEKPCRK